MKTSLLKKVIPCMLTLLAANPFARAQTDLSTSISNGTATPIAYGAVDDTWEVLPVGGSNYQPAYVCSNLNGAWAVNSCGRWITHALSGTNPVSGARKGTYFYQAHFSPVYNAVHTATLNFSFIGGDNNVTGLSINGHLYNLNPPQVNDFNPLIQNITIAINPTDIVMGSNEIAISVYNSENATGFYVCGEVQFVYHRPAGPQDSTGDATTSISGETLPGRNIQLYPNPGKGIFHLVLDKSAEGTAEVMDMTGRKVKELALHSGVSRYTLDMSGSAKGIYSLIIRTGQQTCQLKMALQ